MENLSQSLPMNAAAAAFGGPGLSSANPTPIEAEGDKKDLKIGGPGPSSTNPAPTKAEGDNKDQKIGGPGPSSADPASTGAEGHNKDQKISGPSPLSANPPTIWAPGNNKDPKIGGPGPSSTKLAPIGPPGGSKERKMRAVEQLVLKIGNSELRENALVELAKKRELFQDLAPLLWNSFGTIAALLQEIVSIYPVLSPPNLTPTQSNRVCNALALLQCVASHADTRMLFLKAQMPLYLYPFLNTTSKSRPFEYLRLTSLGVIGALVKVDDTEVISFLLSTEIIPLCLRTMEMGSELSKTVATFIVQKILLDDVGLDYICTTAERFFAVGRVLGNMVESLAEQPSSRLLKHIIRCYLRLSDNSRACDALRSCLPDMLRDSTFSSCLREDPTARRWLQQLLHNVQGPLPLHAGSSFDHMPC